MVADDRPVRTRLFTSYARSAASAWISARESGDKLTRFGPFSSQCRAGNVKIRRGAGNEELFRVLEGFPDLRFGKYSLRLRASAKRVSRVPTSASALSLTPTTAPTIPLECEHRAALRCGFYSEVYFFTGVKAAPQCGRAGASHPGLCFVKDQQMPPSRLI
jgi:hypothetical protein